MERQRDTNVDSAYTQQVLLYIECISTSVLSFLMALNDGIHRSSGFLND